MKESKDIKILKLIEKIGKDHELDTSLFYPDNDIPKAILTLFLGADSQKRPFVLKITADEQLLNPNVETGIYRISLQVKLPFKIKAESFSQTSNLVSFINHFSDFPGFELDEIEEDVYYRYILMIDEKGMKNELILGIIGMIKFLIDIHAESIETVATGKMTYDQLLSEALKASA